LSDYVQAFLLVLAVLFALIISEIASNFNCSNGFRLFQ